MRKSREDWLLAGLHCLAEEGLESLKVDRMCKRLGVTKGSFYHHFASHKDFLEGILESWEREYTLRFIEESNVGEEVGVRLNQLSDLVLQSYGTEEVRVRAWAQSSELAARYVTRVDARPMAYLEELFVGLLGDPERARVMACLMYTTLIGSAQLLPPIEREELRRMFGLLQMWAGVGNKGETV